MADFPWWAFFLPRSYKDLKTKEEEERKRAAELAGAYGGLEQYSKIAGEGPAIRAFESIFGKRTPIPQKTTYETTGELGPSYEFPGMEAQGIQPPGYTTQPRTTIQWPPQTAAQILERGATQYLQQPGAVKEAIRWKVGGELSPGEQMKFDYQKRHDVTILAQSWIKEGVPEATDYWTALLNGEAPAAELPPLAKTENQWEYRDALAGALAKRGLYGQKINNVDPINNVLVRKAEAAGAAIVDNDGTILSASQVRKSEAKAPTSVEEYKFYRKEEIAAKRVPVSYKEWQQMAKERENKYDVIENIETGEQKYIAKGGLILKGWKITKPAAVSISFEKVPESIRSGYIEAEKGKNVILRLENMWNKLPHYSGIKGKFHGWSTSKLAATGELPEVKAYMDFAGGVVAPLVRSLGEKGALTDVDIERAMKLIPKYPDTKEEAEIKIKELKGLMKDAFRSLEKAAVLSGKKFKKSEKRKYTIIGVE